MNILSAVKGQTHVLQKAKEVELQNAYFKGANPKIRKNTGRKVSMNSQSPPCRGCRLNRKHSKTFQDHRQLQSPIFPRKPISKPGNEEHHSGT